MHGFQRPQRGAHVSNKQHGALLVWTGLLKGIPDLIVLTPGGQALFLEVKSETGVVSDAQRKILLTLQSLGFSTAVIRSIDDAAVSDASRPCIPT